jgi:hypothetical protein
MSRQGPANLRLIESPEQIEVPESGAVSSVQRAELDLPAASLERLWNAEHLERLARAYWRNLHQISLGLLRVVYEPTARIVVLLFRPFALLRFHSPDYEVAGSRASVTWRIERGMLVAKGGEGEGFLRISVERMKGGGPDDVRLLVSAEVQNFYPWLRGGGRFARFGTWLYGKTQMRIHEIVTNRFLCSLASLNLPPSRVGALSGEIRAGDPATPAP